MPEMRLTEKEKERLRLIRMTPREMLRRQKNARRRKPRTEQAARPMRRPVQSISRFETGKPMRPRAEVKTKEGFPGFKKGGMKKTLTGGQLKIAAKAPPTNKIDEKDFAVLREEKAKGRGKGLQDEKMKPGKVMKARSGEFIKRRMLAAGKSDGDTSFDAKKRAQDMGIIDKKTGAGRKRFMEKAKSVKLGKRLLIPIAIGIAGVQALKSKIKKKEEKNKKTLRDFREQKKPGIPSEKTKTINKALNKLNKKMGGGMMKRPMGYTKGGGADTGRIGELKSKIGVLSNKLKRRGPGTGIPTSADMKKIKERLSLKNLKQAGRTGAVKLVERSMKILKDNKKMGGGMMQRPMGMMKKGQMVKARGGGMARIKPTKMF
jgi:hypothetical protein